MGEDFVNDSLWKEGCDDIAGRLGEWEFVSS